MNHYENDESVYLAVAEEDEDAIYATFTALHYERKEDEDARRQAPPPPVTSKPYYVNGRDVTMKRSEPGTSPWFKCPVCFEITLIMLCSKFIFIIAANQKASSKSSYPQGRVPDREPIDTPPQHPTVTPRDSVIRPQPPQGKLPKRNPLEEPQKWLVSFDRDEARRKLFESREGTFLIRKAGNPRPDHDDPMAEHQYTLDILHFKDVKHVKINFHKGIEKYGFAAPYEFVTLVELVKFYSKKSLKQHNTGLDTVLMFPLYHQQ